MKANYVQPVNETGTRQQGGDDLLDSLAQSKIFQDYERAFSETTGLPVSLRSVESWQLSNHASATVNR